MAIKVIHLLVMNLNLRRKVGSALEGRILLLHLLDGLLEQVVLLSLGVVAIMPGLIVVGLSFFS